MSLRAELLEPCSPDWERLLAAVRADAYHLPGYVETCARQEGGDARLFVAVEGDNVWVQPLIVRALPVATDRAGPLFDAVSPYGYSGPLARVAGGLDRAAWMARAAAQFKQCLAGHRLVTMLVRLHPLLNDELDPLREHGAVTQRGQTVVIDLRQSKEALWHQTRRDHRRNINKLMRAGFVASITNRGLDLEAFRAIYEATMRRVGAANSYFFPKDYYEHLAKAMNGKLFLCTVTHGQRAACAGLFMEVDGIVQFHLSGTSDDFVAEHPSKLMLHFVRSWAQERDNDFFHLGGGLGGLDDRLLDFKSGFSKKTLPFYTWDIIIDESTYGDLSRLQSDATDSLPAGDSNFFPLYRARSSRCLESPLRT